MAKNIVIIGAVAVGPKAGCRFKRLCQDGNVTLIDQDDIISYGGCGIPYYISGDVSDASELRSTSFHMVRDEQFFRDDKGVTAMTGTKALKIDRKNKTVRVREKNGNEKDLSYDKLVIGVGTRPRELNIPGTNLKNIYRVGNLHDAIQIKQMISTGKVESAVVVGAGFIGLEMAEALADMWQIETSVVEYCDQVMPGFVGKSLSQMARKCMEEKGVTFYLSECVEAFEGAGAVGQVKTDKRTLPADLVIMAVGVAPNTQLAADAGLEIGPGGFIVVNDHMQTSDSDIYAGGDCVQILNLVSGKPGFFPLGSMANRQGRVIGTNLGTTSTAVFAALGAGAPARRVASAHIAFNLFAGVVALAAMPLFLPVARELAGLALGSEDVPATLALFHTLFNVAGVALAWPLVGRAVSWLSTRFVTEDETLARPLHLDPTSLPVPSLALNALSQELVRMTGLTLGLVREAAGPKPIAKTRLKLRRDGLMQLGEQIRTFLARMNASALPASAPDTSPPGRFGKSEAWTGLQDALDAVLALDVSDLDEAGFEKRARSLDRAFQATYSDVKAELLKGVASGDLAVSAVGRSAIR